MMPLVTLDKDRSKELNKYFDSKKAYIQIALIVAGVIVVLIVYRKFKNTYTT
jgi:hypothetical protein